MLGDGCHCLLPWFSLVSALNGTCLEKLKLTLFTHPSLSCSPSTACDDICLWKDKVRVVSHSSYPEKQERSSHKAVVFARDTWETTKCSCLPCSL